MAYRIFTDATADHSPEMMARFPEVTVLPMEVILNGKSRIYGPGGDLEVAEFYAALRKGATASTTQIRPDVYFKHFTPCLEAGEDILYLCFTSGMSGTYQTAQMCAEELRESFPERIIRCVDTLCASVGEGFLVREAVRKKAEGMGLDELGDWVEANRLSVCHWFTVDTLEFLRRGGRISTAAAVVGTALQIKPMLHVSEEGKLEVAEKLRGGRRAMSAQLARMKKGWEPSMGKLVVIGHGDSPEKAEELKTLVQESFPDSEIQTAPIGPVIGTHTGPDMLALIFWGSER